MDYGHGGVCKLNKFKHFNLLPQNHSRVLRDIESEQHPSSVRHGICQPSTSNDHKCAPGLTNSSTITGVIISCKLSPDPRSRYIFKFNVLVQDGVSLSQRDLFGSVLIRGEYVILKI